MNDGTAGLCECAFGVVFSSAPAARPKTSGGGGIGHRQTHRRRRAEKRLLGLWAPARPRRESFLACSGPGLRLWKSKAGLAWPTAPDKAQTGRRPPHTQCPHPRLFPLARLLCPFPRASPRLLSFPPFVLFQLRILNWGWNLGRESLFHEQTLEPQVSCSSNCGPAF